MKKPMFRGLATVALSCLLSLTGNVALAADVGGTVKGRVTHDSGAGVAGAVVTLTHNEKGIVRSTEANDDGEYVLRNLPVGGYTVTISGEGYNTAKQENLSVIIGAAAVWDVVLQAGAGVEEIVVTGAATSRVDMAAVTGGMSFDDAYLDQLPLDNGFEATALLTPGVVETGSDNFSGATSVGGASSAENGYYLNGINVTQIQSGLGSFGLPWEAVAQTNVQTGGITAEFGGALGGIINAVSKSGTNAFTYGISHRIDPQSTHSQFDSVKSEANPGEYHLNNQLDEDEFTETNVWASGPIVKDKVFFYAVLNPRKTNDEFADGRTFSKRETTSDRWLANFEWYVTDKHSLRLTGFNTKRERITDNYNYDPNGDVVGARLGQYSSVFEDGGDFWGLSYHGELTNTVALDVVYGRTQEEEIPRPQSLLPLVQDCRPTCVNYSAHTDTTIQPQEFLRNQLRVDLSWDLDDHRLKFGLDQYHIDVDVNTRQNGVVVAGPIPSNVNSTDPGAAVDHSSSFGWWAVRRATLTDTAATSRGIAVGQDYVRRRVRIRFAGEESAVESEAFYVQDDWQVSQDITLSLGVRYSSFENTLSTGEVYADLDGNVEPRLGAVWDVNGDGKTKAYVSLGRYFQPVAARMNITQGSSSVEYFDYYATNQVDGTGRAVLLADGSPSRGAVQGTRDYRQTGIIDPNVIASGNLKAMYSDQISLGYEMEVFETLRAGVRATYSEMGRSVEDTDYGPVIVNKLASLGIANNSGADSFYILSNPGEEVQISYDFDLDGDSDAITLTNADTQLPKAERKYGALEFTLGGQLNSDFSFDASYTWSHSYGNTEGLVKTDNDQADPGWTTSYDYGDLMDHGYGNLPNDHRHALKFFGLYDLSESLALGVAFRATSGAPKSIFSIHPSGVDSCAPSNPWAACVSQSYDYVSHYDADGNVVPRGTAGNLPWVTALDVSLIYKIQDLLGGAFSLKATVYNILGSDSPLAVKQEDELPGSAADDYGLIDIYQGQRYLSVVGRLEF